MDFDKWIYDTFSKLIDKDELIYFSALGTVLVAWATFYRENLKSFFGRISAWANHLYKSFEYIDVLDKKVQNIEDNLLAHREFTTKNILPNFEKIKEGIAANSIIYDEKLKNIGTILNNINTELSPNSGKSIKDLINKIVTSVDIVEKASVSLEYQVKKIEARQWNVMINNQDVPMFETDEKGYCLRANKAYLDFVGMQMDDVKDLGWVNVIFLDDRKLVQHEWEGSVEDKRVFDLKYRVQNVTTGRVFTVRAIAQPVFVDKEMVGYIGRYLNMSELVQDQNTGLWIKKVLDNKII